MKKPLLFSTLLSLVVIAALFTVVNPQAKAVCPYSVLYYRAQVLLEQIKIDDARVESCQSAFSAIRTKLVDIQNDQDRVAKRIQDNQYEIDTAAFDEDMSWERSIVADLKLEEIANDRKTILLQEERSEAWAALQAANTKLSNTAQELENVKQLLTPKP